MHQKNDEQGAVLLLTIMFLLGITAMGLVATQISVFEIKISENNRQHFEEISSAEAALNHAVSNFRQLRDDLSDLNTGKENTVEIAKLLNDTKHTTDKDVFYKKNSEIENQSGTGSIALIEIRRIVESNLDVSSLSVQANNVPNLVHRYYSGSVDKKRFAATATAYRRDSSTLSTTWVQKGFSLPAEQDKDLF